MNFKRLDVVLLAALFTFALMLRVVFVVAHNFDGLYGQDAFAYYDFAAAMTQGHAPGVFFWPLGYPALLTIGFRLFGIDATVGQGITILLGALLSPFVYVLARQMNGGRVSGFVAGLLMATCGQAIQSSIVIMADIPALAWGTVSALCLWRYVEKSSKVIVVGAQRAAPLQILWLILCAVTLAIACITRWLYLIFIPIWAVIYFASQQASIISTLKRRAREILLAAGATLLVFIPQVIYSHTNPYPTLNHAWVQGWSPENMLRTEFTNEDGYFTYERVNALYYAQVYYDPYYLASVWTPFILLGILTLLWKREFRRMIFLMGWALLPYVFLAGIPYQNIRFPLIVFPAVVVLIGIGVAQSATLLASIARKLQFLSLQRRLPKLSIRQPTKRKPKTHRLNPIFDYSLGSIVMNTAPQWFKGVALAVLIGIGFWQTYHPVSQLMNDFLAKQQLDRETAAWAAAQIPEGARVYSFDLTLTLEHYTALDVVDLYYQTPETLRQDWTQGEDSYLLINVWSIINQWEGRSPAIAVRWLQTRRGLERIERYQYYTLYRVSG